MSRCVCRDLVPFRGHVTVPRLHAPNLVYPLAQQGHLQCFRFGAAVNKAALGVRVQASTGRVLLGVCTCLDTYKWNCWVAW